MRRDWAEATHAELLTALSDGTISVAERQPVIKEARAREDKSK